jgi:hypothetical protein
MSTALSVKQTVTNLFNNAIIQAHRHFVTAPGVSYYKGPRELLRKGIANIGNTCANLHPVGGTLRQYILGPLSRGWADNGVTGSVVTTFKKGYAANLNAPKNWRQHVLAWGMNSGEFRAYQNKPLEAVRRITARAVHAVETLLPTVAVISEGTISDSTGHVLLNYVNRGIAPTALTGAIGLSTGSAAQATKQALYHRAGLGKI